MPDLPSGPLSPETVEAVVELLQAADQYGVPVGFVPDPSGWKVIHMLDWPAQSDDNRMCWGQLASSYDLETTAKASLRPLLELGERWLDHLEPKS